VTEADRTRRTELLEESLAELLEFVVGHDFYDDQLDDQTAWQRRLEPHRRPDGLAPLAPLYEDVFVRLDELPVEVESLSRIVERAEALLVGGRFEGALGRARLRRRLAQRRSTAPSED
jgi:hypothetical protein